MLEAIGFRAEMAGCAAAADASVGRVVRVDRGIATVLTEDGPVRVSFGSGVLADMARDPLTTPCTGDWVVVRAWPDRRHTLETVLPRRTALVRATAGRQSHGQVLAANVDLVAAVVALEPMPRISRVERLLAVAWDSGAQPLVVLTKADAVRDSALVAEDVAAVAPGVEVVCTSTVTGEGLGRLRDMLEGRRTLALIGASGHGKSSLTNALVGAEVLSTREIREDGRGRHTSVRRELVPLPTGGAVIDMPGLRGIGLTDSGEGMPHAFADVEALVAQCRFADCGHHGEPGCAVQEALADGTLSVRRYESWQKLQREIRWRSARQDARLRAERMREWKRRRRDAGNSRP